MALDITHEEFCSDIRQIVTQVVEKALQEHDQPLVAAIGSISKAVAVTNTRIDSVEEKMEALSEKVDSLKDKIDFTHKLLHVHVANPSAHARRER